MVEASPISRHGPANVLQTKTMPSATYWNRRGPAALALALSLLSACTTPGLRGDHHQWLSPPAVATPSPTAFAVSVTPPTETLAALLAQAVREELAARGYDLGERGTAADLDCTILFSGDPARAPAATRVREFVQSRFGGRPAPSCVVLLAVTAGPTEPDQPGEVALWSDSGAVSPVLRRTGPSRRTTGAVENPTPPPAEAADGDTLLDPAIARGLREAIANMFPVIDS